MNLVITYQEIINKLTNNSSFSSPVIESFRGHYKDFEALYTSEVAIEYATPNNHDDYYIINWVVYIRNNDNAIHDAVPKNIGKIPYYSLRDKYLRYICYKYYSDRIEKYDGFNPIDVCYDLANESGAECYRVQSSDYDISIKYYDLGSIITYRKGYNNYKGVIVSRNIDFDHHILGKGVNRIYEVASIDNPMGKFNCEYIHHDDVISVECIDLSILHDQVFNINNHFNDDFKQFIMNYIERTKNNG